MKVPTAQGNAWKKWPEVEDVKLMQSTRRKLILLISKH
jgi:hypothetical protein